MEKTAKASILIGREPNLRRLLICITINGTTKTLTVGGMGTVPNTVSRCMPQERKAHCGLEIDENGTMILSNINPQNITFVNSHEILSKRITADCRIALGKDQFVVDLNAILKEVNKIRQSLPKDPGVFYTNELEKVWNTYQRETRDIIDKQNKINTIRSATGIFSMMGILSAVLLPGDIRVYGYVFTAVALVITIYAFVKTAKNRSIDERDEATQKFQRNYVCPNPDCKHFLGNMPYEILIQDKSCRYCRCHWKQK